MATKITGTNTAAAPGVTGDDTDTGLFYGTDLIGFSTGGTERLRIDSSGRLLVGATAKRNINNQNGNSGGDTVTPLLYVEGTGDSKALSIVSNNTNAWRGSVLGLARTRGTSVGGNTVVQDGDNIGQIVFAAGDGTDLLSNCALIAADIDGTPGGNDTPGRLEFYTTADGAVTATERLRIDSSGNTLVNVTTATAGSYTYKLLSSDNIGSGEQTFGIQYPSVVTYGLNAESNADFTIKKDGTERLRITSDGQISINKTSPKAWNTSYTSLQIHNAGYLAGSTDNSFVALGANNYLDTGGSYDYTNSDFASQFYQVDGTFVFRSAASGTADNAITWSEKVRIASDGKVGIGTSSPQRELHLVTAGNTGIRIEGGASNTCQLLFTPASGTEHQGRIGYYHDEDYMDFYTAANERMRITSTGSVGIGLTDPDVYYAEDLVVKCTAAEGGITVRSNGTTDTNYLMFADGTSGNERYRGYIGYAHNTGASGGEHMQFASAGNTVARLYSNGLILNGTDTSDNNKLDDYEEGTWTPTDSSGGSLSLTTSLCHYTKVGRLVTITARIQWPTTSDSNYAVIGVPYTASFTPSSSIGSMVAEQNVENEAISVCMNDATSCRFIENGYGDRYTNSTFSGKTLRFTFSYHTT